MGFFWHYSTGEGVLKSLKQWFRDRERCMCVQGRKLAASLVFFLYVYVVGLRVHFKDPFLPFSIQSSLQFFLCLPLHPPHLDLQILSCQAPPKTSICSTIHTQHKTSPANSLKMTQLSTPIQMERSIWWPIKYKKGKKFCL